MKLSELRMAIECWERCNPDSYARVMGITSLLTKQRKKKKSKTKGRG